MAKQANNNFDYNASTGAAIIFAVLFGLVFIAHLVQAVRGKCRYLIALLVATGFECIGYIFRYIAIKHGTNQTPLILSQVFIIVSPAFLAANEYQIVGRIIGYVGAEHSYIKPTRITRIFVGVDIITIVAQAGGASLLSGHNVNQLKTGRLILIIALIAQVVSFAVFLSVAIVFDIRTRSRLGSQMKVIHPLLYAFYFSASLIIIRSIYRTIEFSLTKIGGGEQSGYVVTHEWLFYVFDSVLIFAATIIFNIIHPSNYIPSRRGLRMDGTTYEVEGSFAWCCCCCGNERKRKERGAPAESNTQLKPLQSGYVA